MNFKLFASVAAAAMAFVGTAAHAQDSYFGGLKAGVVAGYDDVTLSAEGESGSKGGFLYGVTAGYDYDLGTAVVGIEGEAAWSTAKESLEGDSIRAGRDLYVGARLGFPVTSSVLVYAKAGYTNTRVELSIDDGDLEWVAGKNMDGYRLGAGLEYSNAAKFGRLEYRFSDYGAIDAGFTDIDAKRHQVVVTAGLRF